MSNNKKLALLAVLALAATSTPSFARVHSGPLDRTSVFSQDDEESSDEGTDDTTDTTTDTEGEDEGY